MKYCPECGHKLPSGTEKFCPSCGQKLIPGEEGGPINIGNTSGGVFGTGFTGSGNITAKKISYTVQGNVYNVINSPQEVQEGFRKINTISTQLGIAQYHGTTDYLNENVENTKEVAYTRQVAHEFLEEISRIEKEKGTEIKEIKVGDLQISKNELSLKEIILRGNEHFFKQEYNEAIRWYDKAIEVNPDYTYVLDNKGIALYNLGKHQEAIECYDKSLQINPNNRGTLLYKGLSLLKLGKFKEVMKCVAISPEIDPNEEIKRLGKALEIDPNDADVWNNKGYALAELGKHQEAIECYDKALEIDPNHTLAQKHRNILLEQLSSGYMSIEYFDKALKINPNYVAAWNRKGYILNNLGKYNEAIECYDKALEIDPNFTLAQDDKANLIRESSGYK